MQVIIVGVYAGKVGGAVGIAYGGILNLTENVLCESNKSVDLQSAIKFALNNAEKRKMKGLCDENGKFFVSQCSIQKIVYTRDGNTPAIFSMIHPYDINKVIETPLVWGKTYKFKISCQTKTKIKYVHSFTVTEYMDKELYMFEHRLYPLSLVEERHFTEKSNLCPFSQKRNFLNSKSCSVMQITDFIRHEYHKHSIDRPSTNIKEYLDTEFETKYTTRKFMSFQNSSTKFNILTFNIWNTNTVQDDTSKAKFYKERIKHIIQLCKKVNADVISFQEVRFEDGRGGSYGPNQVRHLSGLLKDYQYIYQPAQIQEHGLPHRIEEGVAIFSKHPIFEQNYHLLSRNRADVADSHQRILLHAKIHIPDIGPINIFNTHLSLSHIARQRTVIQIWNIIRKYTEPVFLMGDFNAEAHNDEIRFLSGLVNLHAVKTRELYDVWTLKHGTRNPGFTFSTLDKELSKRIDLIFMKSHTNIKLLDVQTLDDGLRKEKAASDHVGLLATFHHTSTKGT